MKWGLTCADYGSNSLRFESQIVVRGWAFLFHLLNKYKASRPDPKVLIFCKTDRISGIVGAAIRMQRQRDLRAGMTWKWEHTSDSQPLKYFRNTIAKQNQSAARSELLHCATQSGLSIRCEFIDLIQYNDCDEIGMEIFMLPLKARASGEVSIVRDWAISLITSWTTIRSRMPLLAKWEHMERDVLYSLGFNSTW